MIRTNTSLKTSFAELIKNITCKISVNNWKNCIQQVIKEENSYMCMCINFRVKLSGLQLLEACPVDAIVNPSENRPGGSLKLTLRKSCWRNLCTNLESF